MRSTRSSYLHENAPAADQRGHGPGLDHSTPATRLYRATRALSVLKKCIYPGRCSSSTPDVAQTHTQLSKKRTGLVRCLGGAAPGETSPARKSSRPSDQGRAEGFEPVEPDQLLAVEPPPAPAPQFGDRAETRRHELLRGLRPHPPDLAEGPQRLDLRSEATWGVAKSLETATARGGKGSELRRNAEPGL